MGVVTVSSSAGRTPLGLSTRISSLSSPTKRVSILAFKANKTKNKSLVAPQESVCLPVETSKESPKRLGRNRKSSERVQALPTTEAQAPSCTLDLDFNEAAAKLENIYKLSPPTVISDTEDKDCAAKRGRRRRKRVVEGDEKREKESSDSVVRSQKKRLNRLSLENRIALAKKKEFEAFASAQKRKQRGDNECEKINRLVREYSACADLVSLDWKKMKIPPVLPSSEHLWLFRLMQPMKAIFPTKETLQNDLGREPTDSELAEATNMTVSQLRKHIEVGQAARNKLIKHNLRLILFVINKYFQEFSNSPRFEDLCQAGVNGLITAIDRFEPGRKLRLSTYALFWIRHAIIRFITLSSYMKVPFGLESVRNEIQRAKLELGCELDRTPTEEEIVKKVGISPERYHDVLRAWRPVFSLNARNPITQEEYIDSIASDEGDRMSQPALLRLALDDVLDSLKPKESLVVRQRYGLDGKGDRTLGEIAGNLNISREMVRKHEVKALMKLKHPARVDYIRQYIL